MTTNVNFIFEHFWQSALLEIVAKSNISAVSCVLFDECLLVLYNFEEICKRIDINELLQQEDAACRPE